jgi:hypothetical protein
MQVMKEDRSGIWNLVQVIELQYDGPNVDNLTEVNLTHQTRISTVIGLKSIR